ncbi:glycoside hydrolase family 78 protein [Blautia schinkii]|nr:glycoside hydrolase family 78 protein [Blautia schinkii]
MKRETVKRGIACAVAAAMTVSMTAGSALPIMAADEAQAQSAALTNLKVEGKNNPMGVDTAAPVFAWQMASDAIGASQVNYQITVEKAADGTQVWDSGKVESGNSVDISYEGEALEPCTGYNWTVSVEDNEGNVLTGTSFFETSKLSTELDTWEGAQWIGADELSLDAAASTLFDITTKVQIPEGSTKASVVFGADDFRYNNELFNLYQKAGENYFRMELDVANAGTEEGVAINIYRVGFFENDTPDKPYMTINLANNPNTNLNELITAENKNAEHELELSMSTCTLTVTIDGTAVITGEKTDDFTGESSPTTDIGLADWGSSDVMSVPNLNSIGFSAEPGETAVFTDFELQNPGNGTGTLFGEQAGATYSIWEGKDGVSVEGNKITVDGGESGILAYADPSYASEPYVRTEFSLKDDIQSARLYLAFQGIGDFYINGDEVAPEEWFKQGSMEFRDEIGYNVYDVTDYVASGENAMGAVMGEGWWTGHAQTYDDKIYNYYGDKEALLANLVVTYGDGTTDVITSNEDTWQYYGDGPVRLASIFEGERYDATKEAAVEGFATVEYDEAAAGWRAAQAVETRAAFAGQDLVVREDEEVHVIRELDAELVGETKEGSGSFIYDFGENVAAVPQITIPADYAKEGETLTIRVAEILYPDLEEYGELSGNLLQENYRAALTTDFYTMKAGEQTFVPDLTFHGYRYIEITGLEEAIPAENLKSLVLSSIDNTATYDSSNELVNRLFLNGQNSEASNYITLPTDCPQRNERMGWMGDANVYALAGSYNADTYQFLRQWLNCVRQSQGGDGMTSHTSPNYPSYDPETGVVNVGGMSFGITWNSAIVFIPYFLYQQYGDTTIIDENMDAIYKYMENLEANPLTYGPEDAQVTEAALTSQTGFLCDHLSVVSTDGAMLGNAMYTYCLDVVAQMAAAVGQTDKAEKYNAMYEAAKAAWNSIYIDEETGKSCMADGTVIHTQASYASPLNYGVVAEENKARFVDNYIDTIENPKADDGSDLTPYTLTTGFNATPNLLNALSDNGRADVAYKMLECTDYASWLYPVVQGATSIWERWNSYTVEDGFGGNNGMNSFNHYSLGAVTSWMMDSQLGIKYDEENPGYKHFILQPTTGGTFTYANGSFESAYGTIRSGWEAAEGAMTSYEASVPANTTATLYLPVTEAQAEAITAPEGASFVGMTEHNGQTCAQYELLSGSYSFAIVN